MPKSTRFTLACLLLVSWAAITATNKIQAQGQEQAPSGESGKTAAQLLEEIQKEAKDVEQLRLALDSPDASVRVAAFNRMVSSGNPGWVELAITTAAASADQTLRALAVKAAFKSVSVFNVEIELPKDATEDQKRAFPYVSKSDNQIKNYSYETGRFSGNNLAGHVSGLSVTFQSSLCSGTLSNEKEGAWVFIGTVTCSYSGSFKYKGKFILR